MTYASGNRVLALDFNNIFQTVRSIFGTGSGNFGYGGNSLNVPISNLPTQSIGSKIDAIDWIHIRNAFLDIATHQGVALPDPLPSISDMEAGIDRITYFATLNSTNNNNIISSNRLNVAPGNVSTTTVLTSTRTTAWSSLVRHEFTINFGSENNARFFFNTGGQYRISASRTGGSATPQNSAWTNLLNANSPFIFTGTHYFNLTGNFQNLRSVASSGAYGSNMWVIRARRENFSGVNGGNGSLIRIRSDFIDGHPNNGFDTVNGTLTSTIQERRSIGIFVRPAPSRSNTINLTSGS